MSRRMLLPIIFLVTLCGCAAIRYVDYRLPTFRVDGPANRPLPEREAPPVAEAFRTWTGLSPEERRAYPTPYHLFVDTPDVAADHGGRPVGLAFSGGGTRGILFGAACVRELMATDAAAWIEEVDYVSGVSTGAVPAAFFALNRGPYASDRFAFDSWPECFNVDVVRYTLGTLARRPHWVLRDFVAEMNSRPAMVAALAALYFEGDRFDRDSGLTFAHLPGRPTLILGATVIDDPAVPFVQTRLPYRFALDERPEVPWAVTVQSFESFRTDPMAYSLAEACYNSISYPGSMRSGRMEVLSDPAWLFEDLPESMARRMDRARTQPGYEGVYDLKDGGLTDNRGLFLLSRLMEAVAEAEPAGPRPLLIGMDASQLALKPAEPGRGRIARGWFREFVASTTASWQTGQDAYQRLIEMQAQEGAYDLVHLRFTAWVPYGPGTEGADGPEGAYLRSLCRAEPLVGTPERLLDITRSIGTNFTALPDEQMAAIAVAARFAVGHALGRITP